MITVREERLQSFCEGNPVNFNPNGILPMAQIFHLSYSALGLFASGEWKPSLRALRRMVTPFSQARGGFFPMDPLKDSKISTEVIFQMAEMILKYKMNRPLHSTLIPDKKF